MTGPSFGDQLVFYLGAFVLFSALRKAFLTVKLWRVRRWKVTAGVIKDTMLVPHGELAQQPTWNVRFPSFVGQTQYVAVVNYTFREGDIDREGRLQQRFINERAAHKFLAHFHTGRTVSVRHSSVWPYSSTLEFQPAILHKARGIERTSNRKAVSIGWVYRRALFLFAIALAVCVVIGVATLLIVTITHRI